MISWGLGTTTIAVVWSSVPGPVLYKALVVTQPLVRSVHWCVDEIPEYQMAALVAFLQYVSSRLECVTLTCRYDNNGDVTEKLVLLLGALSYNQSGRIRSLHLMGVSWEDLSTSSSPRDGQTEKQNANTLQVRLANAIERLESLENFCLTACSTQFRGIVGQGLVDHPMIKKSGITWYPRTTRNSTKFTVVVQNCNGWC